MTPSCDFRVPEPAAAIAPDGPSADREEAPLGQIRIRSSPGTPGR